MSEMQRYQIDRQFFVISSDRLDEVKSYIYGFSVQDDGIVDYSNFTPELLKGLRGNGGYVSVEVDCDLITIRQDAIGCFGLYLYQEEGYFALSNSFYELYCFLLNNRTRKLTCNRPFFDHMMIAGLCCHSCYQTPINEILMLPSDVIVTMSKVARAEGFRIVRLKETRHTIDPSSEEGLRIIDSWYQRWAEISKELSNKGNVVFDLSGGFDSRLTLLFALSPSSCIDRIKINSIDNDLHTHAEDFKIATAIAKKFKFKLNDDRFLNSESNPFALTEIFKLYLRVRMPFHNEMHWCERRYTQRRFHFNGHGGALIRTHWDMPAEKLIAKFDKEAASWPSSLAVSNRRFLQDEIRWVIDHHELAQTDSQVVTSWLFRDSRQRHHGGKEIIENFNRNQYELSPLFDAELAKLKLSCVGCEDENLLYSIILDRFCQELLTFPFDSRRSIDPKTLAFAHSVNQSHPVNWNVLRESINRASVFFVGNNVDECVSPESDVPPSGVNGFLSSVFDSKNFALAYMSHFCADYYSQAAKWRREHAFYPLKKIYPAIIAELVMSQLHTRDVALDYCMRHWREFLENRQPIVSVVIPVYNAERYMRECLDSVCGQSLFALEIICVDDGSTDASAQILDEYAARDTRIRVFHQENRGAALARNAGLDLAAGDWIAFMDPDDRYPDAGVLAKMVVQAVSAGVDICGGSLMTINSKGERIEKKFCGDNAGYVFSDEGCVEYSDYQFDYGYWRFIYRRKFLDEQAIRFPDLRRFQDPPFFVKAMILAKRFYAMTIPTYCYREGAGYKAVDWVANDYQKARHYVDGVVMVMKMADVSGLTRLKNLMTRRLFKGGGAFIWKEELSGYIADSLSPVMTGLADLVSVVVPCYNVEKYVGECLDSLLAQTWRNLEIICVNDGSTDGTLDILERYSKSDSRIKIISKSNGGLGAARNTGMAAAKGKYIYFLDSDDKLDSDGIYALYDLAERECLDQIIMSANVFTDEGEEMPDRSKFEAYYRLEPSACKKVLSGPELVVALCRKRIMPVTQQLRFYRLSYLQEIGFRNPEGILHEDNAIAFTSLIRAHRAMAVPLKYYQRRLHVGSIMQSKDNRLERAFGLLSTARTLKNELKAHDYEKALRDALERAIKGLLQNAFWQIQFLNRELPWCTRREQALKEVESLRAKLVTVENGVKAALRDNVMMRRKAAALKRSQDEAQREIAALKCSEAYRVGMFVTWPARRAYRMLKCYRENGLKYTLRRLILGKGRGRK